jgi:hypothetical protein
VWLGPWTEPGSRSASGSGETSGTGKGDTAQSGGFELEKKRGLAILVNCNYEGTSHALLTTDRDREEMYSTFYDQFHYDVHPLINPTRKDLIQLLRAVKQYLHTYTGRDTHNPDGGIKAIVFAFAGHGGSSKEQSDFILAQDWEPVSILSDIVGAFLGHTGPIMHIPKLFFFDACRGKEWLYAAPNRGEEEKQLNYRIDFATIPNHKTPTADRWMQVVAKSLREEKDKSFGDVMEDVKQEVYEKSGTYIQLPETRSQMVLGAFKLWYKE